MSVHETKCMHFRKQKKKVYMYNVESVNAEGTFMVYFVAK
jgi:hypothetical protein